jgi:hypothetical protein
VSGIARIFMFQRSTVNWREVESLLSDHSMPRSSDHPIFAALCLRPSARDPPPIGPLLKTQAKVQFERPVERLLMPFSLFFSGSIWPNFSPYFSFLLFGRQRVANAQRRAAHQSPRLKLSS